MSSIRSSAAGALAAIVTVAAPFASGASPSGQKPETAACKAARLSAWFDHQRQLDVDNNPFFVLPTPKECEIDDARRADNRGSTQAEIVANQAATPSQPATQVR
jgi:hypothetical protein